MHTQKNVRAIASGWKVAPYLLCTSVLVQATSRLAEVFDLQLWAAWFDELDRGFLFLLLLPFMIAVIGLWATFMKDDDDRDPR